MKAVEIRSDDVKSWVEEKLAQQRLPVPKRPFGTEPEYEFPEDPSALTGVELSQWMARFSGFLGYTTRLLGNVESELVLVEGEYRLAINARRQDVLEELSSKRPAAEVVEAEVLRRNDDLVPLYERRLKLLAVQKQLEARAAIYTHAHATLSRELSRRDMESRT